MSIKNKFVTAITTAGLLAGLFGSAFVPSAFAVRTIDTDESYAFVNDSGLALNGMIGINTDQASGHRNDYSDMYGYYGNADYELPTKLQISSYVNYGVFGRDAGDWDYNPGRNGTTNSTYGDDFSIGFYLQDDEGDSVQSADLTATVTGAKIKVAFAYNQNDSERVRCSNPDLQDEFKTSGDSVTDATADADDGSFDFSDDGVYFLCIKAVSATTLGVSNLVIKADGVTVWSGSVQVIGDLAAMEISVREGYNRVAADNEDDSLFFKVVMKDAAGQAICGTQDGFTNDCDDDNLSFSTPSYYARGSNSANLFAGFQQGEDAGQASLDSDVCAAADAGDTKSGAVRAYNYEGDAVTSNSVSIVCTQAQSKFVVAATGISQEHTTTDTLRGEADWDASAQGEDDASGEIEIYAVIKDGTGALMGVDDSTGFNTGMTYTITGNADLNIDAFSGDADAIGVGGKVVLGHYEPTLDVAAKFMIAVAFVDGNGATTLNQAVAKSLYYIVSALDSDYTLTRVRNGAKTSATWTADWGLDCSNAVVYFDWVNKNGTKGTLATGVSPIQRRANIDGVATFTLKKRNMTIYVTAYACDDFSDSPDELGPVKARFR